MHGIASIDVYHSRELAETSSPESSRYVIELFQSQVADKVCTSYGGVLRDRTGDESIFVFDSLVRSVYACMDLLEQMGQFNAGVASRVALPIYIRVGLVASRDDLDGNVEQNRTPIMAPILTEVQNLQNACPTGGLAISAEVYAHLGPRQRLFRHPSSPVLNAVNAYVYVGRQTMPHYQFLDGLTPDEMAAVAPIHFVDWAHLAPDFTLYDVGRTFEGPVLVVLGETARRVDSHHGSAATSDSVGIIEIFASLSPNPEVCVAIDRWDDAADLSGQRDVILLGSGLSNIYSFAVNDMVEPVSMAKHSGRMYGEIIARGIDEDGCAAERHYGSRQLFGRHCALVVYCRSPFNSRQRLLCVSGITGRGTQAGVRFVSDLISDPRSVTQHMALPESFPPVAAVVGAVERHGESREEPPTDRRVQSYELLWACERNGRFVDALAAQV